MAIGYFFQLGGGAYLLLGVPLLLVFQLLVARRPLRVLWVQGAGSFPLDFRFLAMALALLVVPLLNIFFGIRDYGAMHLIIVLGAFPCAFALSQQRFSAVLKALPLFVLSIAIGCAIFAGFSIWHGNSVLFSPAKIAVFLTDAYCITLAGFLVEEVVFRGGLDGYLSTDVANIRSKFVSAVFTSFLWGIWHLPLAYLYPSREIGFLSLAIVLNILWGTPLSMCCRTSGTLLLPALVHAICDAYRNVL